ncbi:HEAT repeat domain-containing protein [Methanobrevibacter sp.]|uniref:HEAT repeat domain-containing protein n=1 Tax=Methanobrevibacter sp. TaxID=66852 RepID=UPI003869C131
MDFDIRRADLVKMTIKNAESGQEIVADCLENKIHMTRPEDYEYDSGEAVFDILTLENSNWYFKKEKDKAKIKVETRFDEDELVNLAINHPESHVRIAAIGKINNDNVLLRIVQKDSDEEVKKAALERLSELHIKKDE